MILRREDISTWIEDQNANPAQPAPSKLTEDEFTRQVIVAPRRAIAIQTASKVNEELEL